MVAFQTLLLGIIFGLVPIRVMVAPPVATVELQLDGASIGVLRGPPWGISYDFGSAPMPHELTAVARDGAGREVGRATRWINLIRKKADVSVLLERDQTSGRPVAARVAWSATGLGAPTSVTATLDGAPLEVVALHRIQLAQVDPVVTHLLGVEVTFAGGLRDRCDLAFGGEIVDSAQAELTAVAVTLPVARGALQLNQLDGVFSVDSVPGNPVVVEKGRAEVALVIDQAAHWGPRCAWPDFSEPPKLKDDADRFFVVVPVADRTRGADGHIESLFPMSAPMRLPWLDDTCLLRAVNHRPGATAVQTIPEAVATAGAQAAATGHRRAVVLILSETPPATAGAHLPTGAPSFGGMIVPGVKEYLRALDVPLAVWSLTGEAPGPFTALWGPVEDVSTRGKLRAAARRLFAAIDLQRIVWFGGQHLPQRITLDETRTALRLAR
jgi:hypothetical protein